MPGVSAQPFGTLAGDSSQTVGHRTKPPHPAARRSPTAISHRPAASRSTEWRPIRANIYENLFVAEVSANAVHRETMVPEGVTFAARVRRSQQRVRSLDRQLVPACQFHQRARRHAARTGHVPRNDRASLVDPRRYQSPSRSGKRPRPRAALSLEPARVQSAETAAISKGDHRGTGSHTGKPE